VLGGDRHRKPWRLRKTFSRLSLLHLAYTVGLLMAICQDMGRFWLCSWWTSRKPDFVSPRIIISAALDQVCGPATRRAWKLECVEQTATQYATLRAAQRSMQRADQAPPCSSWVCVRPRDHDAPRGDEADGSLASVRTSLWSSRETSHGHSAISVSASDRGNKPTDWCPGLSPSGCVLTEAFVPARLATEDWQKRR